MLAGAVPSVLTGYLADRFGRLKLNVAGAVLFGIGVLLQGTAYTLPHFMFGRALAGLGEGVFLANLSVYICEISPARSRGMLAALPQFMSTAGVCVGYFAAYGTVYIDSSLSWRLPYVIQGVCAVLFGAGSLVLPESPRWLLLHGRRADAMRALERLDFSRVEAERDFLSTSQSEQKPSLSPWQSFTLLFKRGYRTRTTLAIFILGMIQLSGIDGVVYLCNWIVAMITPILLDKSAFGAYFLFAGLAFGTTAVLAAYMPETRGRSLESIQEAFHRPPFKGLDHYLGRMKPRHRRAVRDEDPTGSGIELGPSGPGRSAASSVVDAASSGLRLDVST
ncbi:hypothetical protein K4K48_000445 [Colletotrichum sp. SAR 10_66]|nr:hypothetical protein K4K51_004105 [Colletotrichum sp. SAR 10_75]KAJ5002164.1 hypothetical protein K4K48_000445 [Colletotrichum sp. SAR 10_66]